MSEQPVVYGDVPVNGSALWEAYQRAIGRGLGPATNQRTTFDVFRAGFEAGQGACARPCCAQTRLDLEPAP